jgi:two-component system response regulator YesN
MYKVILVDDEQVIRQGLKKILDWTSLGFEIIDEAENGLRAYEKIKTLNPDLVLLDIRMPGLDGIGLLEKLRQEGSKCRVIYLTGFAEFEYAKRAISLGVEAFLTKPFDEDELINELKVIRKKLDSKKQIEERLLSQEKLRLKQQYRRLLFGEKLDVELSDLSSDFCVAEIQTKASAELFNAFFDEYQKHHSALICILIAGNWVLIFKNTSMTRIKVALHNLSNELDDSFAKKYFISVGRMVVGHHELYKSFEDVNNLGQRWYLTDDENITYYREDRNNNDMLTIDNDLMVSYLEVGNREGISHYTETLENGFIKTSLSMARLHGLIVNSLMIIIEKIKVKEQVSVATIDSAVTIMDKIYKTHNLQNLMQVYMLYIDQIYNLMNTGSRDDTLVKVLDYIDNHYSKNLKLERLGEIFGYNSSYLGTIFKQHTGMSFKNYLDSVRIEMSKKLLEEGVRKVYEIAELVGYRNVDYFHSKFKKYEHVSPKKYQLSCKGKS